MKIVSLVENTTKNSSLRIEHGLSLYIESCDKRILFDMGQTDAFYLNSLDLGIDLSLVDLAILSHGHYDHGGGLSKFLEINKHAPVYIRKDAFLPHYNGEKYIGLDSSLLESERIIFTEEKTSLFPFITLFSLAKGTPCQSELTERVGEKFIPDDFRHEQYLMIEEGKKRILFSGCSHRGIITVAEHFRPDILIGGFHFSKLSLDGSLLSYARRLSLLDTDFYTCHCTGVLQFEFMRRAMPRLHYLATGDTVEL